MTAFFQLLACFACFAAASGLYMALAGDTRLVWSTAWLLGLSISAGVSWQAIALFDHPRERGFTRSVDQFLYAAGLTILAEYGVAYIFWIPPIALWVIVTGALLSTLSAIPVHEWTSAVLARGPGGVLFVGFDSVARALVPAFEGRVIGVLDSDPARVPPELPFLGQPARLGEVVETFRPRRIIVRNAGQTGLKGTPVPPRLLLDLQYSGIVVEEVAPLYESRLGRVYWPCQQAFDFLFSDAAKANRPAMAVQAIYTNVIGLVLLLVLSPVLAAVAALSALSSHGGPVLERIECLGFQRIPFQMLRFRTRDRDGRLTRAGNALSRLHLVNLPGLINVVRGEMVLFGPPPVRKAFADRLSQIIPVYPHRFTVKPGVLGWSQAHLCAEGTRVVDETLRLEYDFCYVKQNSPSLDLEILARTILPALFRSTRVRDAVKNS